MVHSALTAKERFLSLTEQGTKAIPDRRDRPVPKALQAHKVPRVIPEQPDLLALLGYKDQLAHKDQPGRKVLQVRKDRLELSRLTSNRWATYRWAISQMVLLPDVRGA